MTTKQEPSTFVIEIPTDNYCEGCIMFELITDSIFYCNLFDRRIEGEIKCEPCKQKQKVEIKYL
jgi:hypothetical protein